MGITRLRNIGVWRCLENVSEVNCSRFLFVSYSKREDKLKHYYENTITILDNYGKDAICEIMINNMPEILEDKKLSDARLRDTYKLNVLMIKRRNKIVDITKNTIIQFHDVVVVFGPYQNIKDLFSINVNSIELVDQEAAKKQNVFS